MLFKIIKISFILGRRARDRERQNVKFYPAFLNLSNNLSNSREEIFAAHLTEADDED